MIENDSRDAGSCLLARPITLPFAQHCHPGDRHRTCGDHTLHGHVMRFEADAARGVGDDENVISLAERLDRRHGEADLGLESGEYELLAPALLHDVGNFRVFPSVNERAVDRLLLGEDILKPHDDIPAAFFNHRGQDRGHVEDFRRLGQANDVVDDHRRLVAVQVGELVRLMVDQHEDAFFGASRALRPVLALFVFRLIYAFVDVSSIEISFPDERRSRRSHSYKTEDDSPWL